MGTRRTTPTKRKAAPKAAAAKKGNAKKPNALKATALRAKAKKPNALKAKPKKPNVSKTSAPKPNVIRQTAITPRSVDDDEIELSGVFGVVRYKESDPYAEVREIYDHYDRDKDGVISPREFARVLEALGMELEEHELKLALGEVDRDGSDTIEWDEFLAWWRSMRG
jgi:hypothetical protein